jgi:hypothetical protein
VKIRIRLQAGFDPVALVSFRFYLLLCELHPKAAPHFGNIWMFTNNSSSYMIFQEERERERERLIEIVPPFQGGILPWNLFTLI